MVYIMPKPIKTNDPAKIARKRYFAREKQGRSREFEGLNSPQMIEEYLNADNRYASCQNNSDLEHRQNSVANDGRLKRAYRYINETSSRDRGSAIANPNRVDRTSQVKVYQNKIWNVETVKTEDGQVLDAGDSQVYGLVNPYIYHLNKDKSDKTPEVRDHPAKVTAKRCNRLAGQSLPKPKPKKKQK